MQVHEVFVFPMKKTTISMQLCDINFFFGGGVIPTILKEKSLQEKTPLWTVLHLEAFLYKDSQFAQIAEKQGKDGLQTDIFRQILRGEWSMNS